MPEKGCHYLLEAFGQLKTDARLVMAGGSSFSDGYVDSLMRIRAGDERILMLGYVYGEVLDELWSNAYMVIQPSILEGLSISLIEAISHGKCVLASDIPENLEVVEDCAVTFRTRDVDDLREQDAPAAGEPRPGGAGPEGLPRATPRPTTRGTASWRRPRRSTST